jgi:hypothetical protein
MAGDAGDQIWLSTKISVRNGLIFVGFLVVIISLKTMLAL